jgi:hypothetical protein
MKPTRLRAPSHDGGLLARPPLDESAALIDANVERGAAWEHDFQGRPASWLRDQSRREAVAEAISYLREIGVDPPAIGAEGPGPLVVTGHQPEMFHPGVWVKNFAAAGISGRSGGHALNLVVDDDFPKSASIRVPTIDDGRLVGRKVEFDRWRGEAPYEDLPVRDEDYFASFDDRVRRTLGGLVADPIIDVYWPEVARYRDGAPALGYRLAAARRRLEGMWGVANLEVPFSRLCQTEGFAWFACHLLAQLERFQSIYNQALVEYRAVYGIRSKNHPVSALKSEGDWREAPFWVWRASSPRRHPLMVRQDAGTMLLRIAGESDPILELPLAPDREACCAVERLLGLPATGVRLRTRALTTTMFSRYLLGDLFIHGIGGAKYDELGDAIARRFFRTEPPGFLTLSLTTWLGLPEASASPQALAGIDLAIRDLEFNPDRLLNGEPSPEAARLIAEKRALAAVDPSDPAERRERFRRFRAINEALHPLAASRLEELRQERARTIAALDVDRLARNREYSMVLYSRERLRRTLSAYAAGGEAATTAP